MEWYMLIIYSVLMFGAINSWLNYRLQSKWFEQSSLDRSEINWLRLRIEILEDHLMCTKE